MATKETVKLATRAAQVHVGRKHCLCRKGDLSTWLWLEDKVKVGDAVKFNGENWEVREVYG